jgi:hypothetical protein
MDPEIEALLSGIEREPCVEAVRGLTLEVFVGDHPVALGAALVLGPGCVARVTGLLGQRRVEAQLLSVHPAAQVGAPVHVSSAQAMLPAPKGDVLRLDGASFVVEGGLLWEIARPSWLELDPARPALALGDDVLDVLCPLAARGFNLVVDGRGKSDAFCALAGHMLCALGSEVLYVLGELEVEAPAGMRVRRVRGAGLIAWRALVAWACQARDAGCSVAVVGELTMTGEEGGATLGQVIELVGAGLCSTRAGAITSLVRLAVPGAGLMELVETLGLGDVDAQLVMLASGRIDAQRSTSRAEVSAEIEARRAGALAALAAADELIARRKLFGDDELSDGERALIEEASRWR